MAQTHEQALAFIDSVLRSPRPLAHLEAHLGYGLVPAVTDFLRQNAESFDRTENLLGHLEETIKVLRVVHSTRPRQKTFDELPREGQEVAAEPYPGEGEEEDRTLPPAATDPRPEPKRKRGRPRKERKDTGEYAETGPVEGFQFPGARSTPSDPEVAPERTALPAEEYSSEAVTLAKKLRMEREATPEEGAPDEVEGGVA